MIRMFNNKKGQAGTGAFNALAIGIDGIKSFISWFFTTIPKPLLFIMFLMFILLLGNFLIPILANSMGYHCDSNHQVWKISAGEVFTNFDLIRKKPDIETASTEKIPFLCGGSGRTAQNVAECTNCTRNESFSSNYNFRPCASDGSRLDDYNFYLKFQCNWLGCAPEEGYIYDYDNDVFTCTESFCINRTLDDYNKKIYETEGASPAYQNPSGDMTPEGMIYFKCKEENPLNIRFTLFGIDIFDFRIWVLLGLMGIIVFVYFLIK